MSDTPSPSGRTIAIGDVHGCARALDTLLAAIDPQPGDTLVTLGDVIDRGPDSRGVVERLLELEAEDLLVPILGNHEVMLFAVLADQMSFTDWILFGGDTTLTSYRVARADQIPAAHLDFLGRFRLTHETARHIFVHANYEAGLPLDKQPSEKLLWDHVIPQHAAPHLSGKTVVVGHTPQQSGRILDLGCLLGLDTNCCRGGWLTAYDVDARTWWQANERGRLRTGPAGP